MPELVSGLAAAQDCGAGMVPDQETAMAKEKLAARVDSGQVAELCAAAQAQAKAVSGLAALATDQAQALADPERQGKVTAELAGAVERLASLASALAAASAEPAAAAKAAREAAESGADPVSLAGSAGG